MIGSRVLYYKADHYLQFQATNGTKCSKLILQLLVPNCKWQCCIKYDSKYINSYYVNNIKKVIAHMIFFRVPNLFLCIDLNNVFHRRKKVLLTKELPGCWGAEPGMVLFLCLLALNPSTWAYSSPGTFIFFWKNNQRSSIIFCVCLAFVAHHWAFSVSQV